MSLQVSVRYANVAISLFDEDGNSFIYGYVPIVVAKCGVFLKERGEYEIIKMRYHNANTQTTAIDIEGIFRLAGAERRIKELVTIFNSPDKYGKGLDWTGYSVHDAANVLRRYLNQLPEPIIPLNFYERFRQPLQAYNAQVIAAHNGQIPAIDNFDFDSAIRTYQQLITELPPLNRQLLLYLLDLLAVFASKSEVNRMNSSNLSSIFQPGILSHPTHDMVPEAYRLSQDVLIFLIEHQDHFLVGMQGTAADEKTIQDVQSGSPSPAKPKSGAITPKNRTQQLIGRSASVASSQSSARRLESIRRNASVSSRGSRHSGLASPSPGPGTPPSGLIPTKSSGLNRSNTVPSQHSLAPVPPTAEVSRKNSGETSTIQRIGTPVVISPEQSGTSTPMTTEEPRPSIMFAPNTASPKKSPLLTPASALERSPSRNRQTSQIESLHIDQMPSTLGPSSRSSPATTPNKERTLSSLFKGTPFAGEERADGRKPNKLQKRRRPENIVSPQSSTHSLGDGGSLPASPAYQQFSPSRKSSQIPVDGQHDYRTTNTFATSQDNLAIRPRLPENYPSTDQTITPTKAGLQNESPYPNYGHSPSSSVDINNGYSSFETVDEQDASAEQPEKQKSRRRWRLSSPKKDQKTGFMANEAAASAANNANVASTSTPFSQAYQKARSTSTVGSQGRSAISNTTDDSYRSTSSVRNPAHEDDERAGRTNPAASFATSPSTGGRSGLSGWFKKLQAGRDRSLSKDRARSPRARSPMPPSAASVAGGMYKRADFATSRQSVNNMLANTSEIGVRHENKSVEALSAAGGQDASSGQQQHGQTWSQTQQQQQ